MDNGLLLRSDLHRLRDRGYVTVTPDYVFRVSDRLRDEFQNGRSYYGLDGAKIDVPNQRVRNMTPAVADLQVVGGARSGAIGKFWCCGDRG